ncbi:C2orf68 isoform 3 [Pan troglodytes]|uniref:C2orf68 isoform 1 n=1 Tax=Pan troglodytes TaxID=9598 RepID=A0A2J8L5L8_PANTR|nr:C2orf68 isoform 1 [Pan troglodytes]PNI42568.1 C2orf68 isoform 3 [Pan troglodytes]
MRGRKLSEGRRGPLWAGGCCWGRRGGGDSASTAPDGGGAASPAGALLQAWGAAGHEPRLRAPYPTEPDRSVPPRPAPPPPPLLAWPGLARPDSP